MPFDISTQTDLKLKKKSLFRKLIKWLDWQTEKTKPLDAKLEHWEWVKQFKLMLN